MRKIDKKNRGYKKHWVGRNKKNGQIRKERRKERKKKIKKRQNN